MVIKLIDEEGRGLVEGVDVPKQWSPSQSRQRCIPTPRVPLVIQTNINDSVQTGKMRGVSRLFFELSFFGLEIITLKQTKSKGIDFVLRS